MLKKCDARIVETEIDDELVVMDIETGDFLSLVGSAREIWGLIDGTTDRAAILDTLDEAYSAPRNQLANDLDAFCAQLREAGLITDG